MNTYQAIGQYLDSALLFAAGLYLYFRGGTIVSKEGSEEDIGKRKKLIRRCGLAFAIGAPVMLALKFID